MLKKNLLFVLSVLFISACAVVSEPSLVNRDPEVKPTAAQASSSQSSAEPSVTGDASVASLSELLNQYRTLQRMTPNPHPVDAYTSMLCRGLTQEDIDRTDQASGPHARAFVHIYANALAAKALTDSASVYPVGAVIIKEKLADFSPPDATQSTNSLGGMRKREAGYDPENGDWEYFYQAAGGILESGKMANCTQCHSQKKPQDYVFKNWLAQPQALSTAAP
jgi:hypothetical protein